MPNRGGMYAEFHPDVCQMYAKIRRMYAKCIPDVRFFRRHPAALFEPAQHGGVLAKAANTLGDTAAANTVNPIGRLLVCCYAALLR